MMSLNTFLKHYTHMVSLKTFLTHYTQMMSLNSHLLAVAACEEQQVPDSQQASASPAGEERHEGHSGQCWKRGLMVLHPALLQTQLSWGQSMFFSLLCFSVCVCVDQACLYYNHQDAYIIIIVVIVTAVLLLLTTMCVYICML